MRYPFFMQLGGRFFAAVGVGLLVLFLVGDSGWAFAQEEGAAMENNRLLSISVDKEAALPTVCIRTDRPVGYRYTVYDSHNPVRVVIDFPGMDVTGIAAPIKVDATPLREIQVFSLDLPSGKLGRVELLLTREAKYDVSLSENNCDFRVSFDQTTAESAASDIEVRAEGVEHELATVATAESEPTFPAKLIESVDIRDGRAVFSTDGFVEKYRYFTLVGPPRLVADIYGVQPSFKKRFYGASQGFRQIRVGTYEDRTRFVFDASGSTLPEHTVRKKGNAIIVSWGQGVEPAAGAPVSVEAVDFEVEGGKSVFSVTLSAPAEVIEATEKENVVHFGVKDASISRALRRAVDTSAFPSAVWLITPYKVAHDVRFAVEMKGSVPYSVRMEGNRLLFTAENGPFAESAPAVAEKVEVPVSVPSPPEEPIVAEPAPPEEVVEEQVYTGEKVSLVFDDADIRKIFQLIGEVSELNIIVSDEVKGTITLRLIDVPWDQALNLILDTKGLGMLREGNVARILPKEKIREMRQADLVAVKTERELEPLVTEVVSVSYTDLKNVSAPGKELLTDRGKITEDSRNKQLIVTDVPSVIEQVKELVAILDTPEKQVMIEARIVEANSNFSHDLGVNWNVSYTDNTGTGNFWDNPQTTVSGGGSFLLTPGIGTKGLNTGLTFGRLLTDHTILDLRLSAAETAGRSKVISKPRVTVLNGEKATISQGTQIPYLSVSESGTETEFEDATLSLEVTPVINPDDTIILEIKASNNTPTTVAGATQPGIDTKEAETKVLVQDSETTVIGGIFVENESYGETGIPLLMKIPLLGHLFKSTTKSDDRRELLIFITPRILD
jgi:type IV pilus assembly protein PilQ